MIRILVNATDTKSITMKSFWYLNLHTEEMGTWSTIARVLSPLAIEECDQTK